MRCKSIFLTLLIFLSVLSSYYIYSYTNIPSSYSLIEGRTIKYDFNIPMVKATVNDISVSSDQSTFRRAYTVDTKLLGILPLKAVDINIIPETKLIPCGFSFGVKLYTNGLMVVGSSNIQTSTGSRNPMNEAGIKAGDVLLKVNNIDMENIDDFIDVVQNSEGKSMVFTLGRKKKNYDTVVTPVKSDINDKYAVGMWVRDSSAGIGTMTFIDENSGMFVGLGHGICDMDTNDLMPLKSGTAVRASITGIRKGESGTPGELKGVFDEEMYIGSLLSNDETGIYGKIEGEIEDCLPALPIALSNEIYTGPAKIYANVEGKKVEQYDIEIVKIFKNISSPTKNMIIRITDPDLLKATSGIVQGMSGCPIIQDGKIIGAITHVLVNEPNKGFAIFIENMLDNDIFTSQSGSQKSSLYQLNYLIS